jgi:transposase-like protein
MVHGFGIYLAQKDIPYYYFEIVTNQFAVAYKEPGRWLDEKVMKKYGAFDAGKPLATPIYFPKSENPFPADRKVEYFDVKEFIGKLSNEELEWVSDNIAIHLTAPRFCVIIWGMKEYPMTFDDFIAQFASEEDCREYLFNLRWKDGFVCPQCGSKHYGVRGDGLYLCLECKHKTSVTTGTIFQDTRKPLRSWFLAIWWVTTQKNGASAEGLQQILGLNSYQTAWTWLHKIRKAMVYANREKLKGRIEVDETYIGGVDVGGASGRGAGKKTLVVAAVEVNGQGYGRVRLRVIDDASAVSLHSFVLDNIEEGSILVTDDWNGYSGIESKGYTREIYKQSIAKLPDEMLPHVHTVISLVKRWLLGTHQGAVSKKHLQDYLEEYTFRFNRRNAKQRELLFYRLLENAVHIEPTTYDMLTK